ncbi:hypothetical protein Tco_1500033 [Tanacetum coccineum]
MGKGWMRMVLGVGRVDVAGREKWDDYSGGEGEGGRDGVARCWELEGDKQCLELGAGARGSDGLGGSSNDGSARQLHTEIWSVNIYRASCGAEGVISDVRGGGEVKEIGGSSERDSDT